MNPTRADGYRRIIHIDMDCFYAAVEIRDRPELADRPVAVGGSGRRGVLTTCNYVARAFGVRSAMPGFKALELCPHLVMLPVDFKKYRSVSQQVRSIFRRYTDVIEPLSLDEAYLDVTHREEPASKIAREIRQEIFRETGLHASAGIAPNMLLAKIASDWRKPNGQFTITPMMVEAFMEDLSLRKLRGIGPKTADKLKQRGLNSCADLRRLPLEDLGRMFGKFGPQLYDQCRGFDDRPVTPDYKRKSISRERTFSEDLPDLASINEVLDNIYPILISDIEKQEVRSAIRKSFVKLKFNDFSKTSAEETVTEISLEAFRVLAETAWNRRNLPVRLVGLGVRLQEEDEVSDQMEFSLEDSTIETL